MMICPLEMSPGSFKRNRSTASQTYITVPIWSGFPHIPPFFLNTKPTLKVCCQKNRQKINLISDQSILFHLTSHLFLILWWLDRCRFPPSIYYLLAIWLAIENNEFYKDFVTPRCNSLLAANFTSLTIQMYTPVKQCLLIAYSQTLIYLCEIAVNKNKYVLNKCVMT